MKLNIENKADNWMISKYIVKMQILDLYECQFIANYKCSSCQKNSKLNQLNYKCECDKGYEKGFLFNDY